MNKRVEVPAVVDFCLDGVTPADEELGQEYADEDQIVKDEAFMDGVVGRLYDGACSFSRF